MKSNIGKYNVVATQALLIPGGEDAWIEFDYEKWKIRLNIILIEDKESPNESAYSVYGAEDHGVCELKNWDAPVGMSFQEPIEFWSLENHHLYVVAFGHKAGDFTKLDVQFLSEVLHD